MLIQNEMIQNIKLTTLQTVLGCAMSDSIPKVINSKRIKILSEEKLLIRRKT